MKKVTVMLDGGHLRVNAKANGKPFTPDLIEKLGLATVLPHENLFRVLYYDCARYSGIVTLPVSGDKKAGGMTTDCTSLRTQTSSP